jgi:hypothetical protein
MGVFIFLTLRHLVKNGLDTEESIYGMLRFKNIKGSFGIYHEKFKE